MAYKSRRSLNFEVFGSQTWNISVLILTEALTDIPLDININIYDLLYRYYKHQILKYTLILKTVIHKPYCVRKKNCKYKNFILYNSYIWKFKSSVEYKRVRWKNCKFNDFCRINTGTSLHWKRKYSFNYEVG